MSQQAKVKNSELFFGLVSPVGSDLKIVTDFLKISLRRVGYSVVPIKISELMLRYIENLPQNLDPTQFENDRISNYMDAGNYIREQVDDGSVLVGLSIFELGKIRKGVDKPIPNTAYVLDSFKHPKEIERPCNEIIIFWDQILKQDVWALIRLTFTTNSIFVSIKSMRIRL